MLQQHAEQIAMVAPGVESIPWWAWLLMSYLGIPLVTLGMVILGWIFAALIVQRTKKYRRDHSLPKLSNKATERFAFVVCFMLTALGLVLCFGPVVWIWPVVLLSSYLLPVMVGAAMGWLCEKHPRIHAALSMRNKRRGPRGTPADRKQPIEYDDTTSFTKWWE